MLNFNLLELRYRPFPIGVIRPALDEDVYAECLRAFPDVDQFEYLADVGHKWSLSEKCASNHYKSLVKSEPVWRTLHQWVKSREFIENAFAALCERNVDLGYERLNLAHRTQRRLKAMLRGRGRDADRYRARFEFSMLPAAGGSVLPHTDNPDKVITIVISMVGDGEWSAEFGGGTDILQPYDDKLNFDFLNDRHPKYSELEVLDTLPFVPNQAVIFAKTFNSWHGVRPMTSPDKSLMRRSLTINIEAR